MTPTKTHEGSIRVGANVVHLSVRPMRKADGEDPSLRVAIFGGTFDPITDGHLKMAAEVIHSGLADVCWIVPCGPRNDKNIRTHILDRLTMAHLAVQNTFSANFPIYVHAVEYGTERALTTPELMARMEHDYPSFTFKFVIGTDLLVNTGGKSLDAWDARPEYTHWVDRTQFVVLQRPGYTLPFEWLQKSNVEVLASPVKGGDRVTTNLSSSEVRWRIDRTSEVKGQTIPRTSFGNRVQGLCDLSVINFMERHCLYTRNARNVEVEMRQVESK